ncbi:MAG: hypothetical protein HY079_02220 [Elusimicrobia bacterium]|nr:hypothetical protein [Elusimicrobiota bacterium]
MLRLALVSLLALVPAAPALAKKAPAVPPPSVPATLPKPLPTDEMGVTIHRLPNGLTVYLSPNKGMPRITAYIAVRAGPSPCPTSSTASTARSARTR